MDASFGAVLVGRVRHGSLWLALGHLLNLVVDVLQSLTHHLPALLVLIDDPIPSPLLLNVPHCLSLEPPLQSFPNQLLPKLLRIFLLLCLPGAALFMVLLQRLQQLIWKVSIHVFLLQQQV